MIVGVEYEVSRLCISTVSGEAFHFLSTIINNNDNNNPDGSKQGLLRRERWLLVLFYSKSWISSVV